MAKKQKHEEHENLERWLVSYADFITLLFAFFVMLYAITSENVGRFKVLSDAIVAVLHHKHLNTNIMFTIIPKHSNSAKGGNKNSDMAPILMSALQNATGTEHNSIQVAQSREGIVIQLSDKFLFNPGEAILKKQSYPELRKIANIIAKTDREIRVRGYTDTTPIHNKMFADNWDLSTARAVNVLRKLIYFGHINPDRLGASGYSQYRPITRNTTEAEKQKNRRVDIVLLAPVTHSNKPVGIPPHSGDQNGRELLHIDSHWPGRPEADGTDPSSIKDPDAPKSDDSENKNLPDISF